jgi:four helix bundle protein
VIADRGLRIADKNKESARVADTLTSVEELRRRTFRFGIRIVRLIQSLPKTEVARVIGNQSLRAGTAVGANYRAAARARSPADFVAKMGIVEEECDETLYWLEILVESRIVGPEVSKELRAEGNELLAIVVASIKTARGNAKNGVRYTDGA